MSSTLDIKAWILLDQIIWVNIKGVHHQVAKIYELVHFNLWEKSIPLSRFCKYSSLTDNFNYCSRISGENRFKKATLKIIAVYFIYMLQQSISGL